MGDFPEGCGGLCGGPRDFRRVFGGSDPTQRARGSKKFILARTHEKITPPRTEFSFSLEIFNPSFEIFILD